jgi:hypothetical protein
MSLHCSCLPQSTCPAPDSRIRGYTNPRLVVAKLPILGKMVDICVALTPNQEARVAAYCTLPVEGTQRPLVPEKSGPL